MTEKQLKDWTIQEKLQYCYDNELTAEIHLKEDVHGLGLEILGNVIRVSPDGSEFTIQTGEGDVFSPWLFNVLKVLF